MDVAAIPYMSTAEISQAYKTAQLEQVYERAVRQSERIYAEEKVRALRVQLFLLEDDKEALQEQVADGEDQIDRLMAESEDLSEQLTATNADLLRVHDDLRMRARDVDHYRAELQSLHATTGEAAKVLTEKLALTRELATLVPELEHLRAQVKTHSNVLAEKLALQRQLSSLEVELETEKRTVNRTKLQGKDNSENDAKVAEQVDALKKDVAKEKREASKWRNKASEYENAKEMLENKLEAFRNKLKSTKEQLKSTQTELEEAQAASRDQAAGVPASKPAANPRKRPVARFDPDMTIGTPGHAGHAAKKAKTAAPGDKSTFSITPFLNRTISVLEEGASEAISEAHQKADEILNSQIDALAEVADNSPTKEVDKAKPVSKPAPTEKAASKKTKGVQPLKESTNLTVKNNANAKVQKPLLERVAEEVSGNEENEEGTEKAQAEPVRKQKIINFSKPKPAPTLFDDENPAPKVKILGSAGLRGGAGLGKVSLMSTGKPKSLMEFSPLKRNYRAGTASFLGGDSVLQ